MPGGTLCRQLLENDERLLNTGTRRILLKTPWNKGAITAPLLSSMRRFLLLEIFLTSGHLFTECLGIYIGILYLGEHVPLLLGGMGRNLTAQFANFLIVPRFARLQVAKLLDRIAGLLLILRRFL